MKKISFFLSALALLVFVSCDENKGGDVDWDNVIEDGFFVTGPATGVEGVQAAYMMTVGANEILMDGNITNPPLSFTEAKRNGMFEKYVILEKNKDFYLVLSEANNTVTYGADLQDVDLSDKELFPRGGDGDPYNDNPEIVIQKGELVIGEDAPKMQVKEDGLYHIILDLDRGGDLPDGPQIIVLPVEWGVSGGMNGWGYTAFPAPTVENGKLTYVLENQKLSKGGEFKFKHSGAWKVTLDKDGKVKAHTNLGQGCQPGAANIVAEQGGKYTITLTYENKGGEIANSYAYSMVCTEVSAIPTECYLTGDEFGGWFGGVENPPYPTVKFTAVPDNEGHFWAVRYFESGKNFKLSTEEGWGGELKTLKYADDTPVGDGNLSVLTSGYYIVYVDLENYVLYLEEAAVYGIGDAFGGWAEGAEVNKFVPAADGKSLTATTSAAGDLRIYVAAPEGITGDPAAWWRREFNIFDGKIEYRGAGGDQTAVPVTANQTVTLDFNAGTGSIQ